MLDVLALALLRVWDAILDCGAMLYTVDAIASCGRSLLQGSRNPLVPITNEQAFPTCNVIQLVCIREDISKELVFLFDHRVHTHVKMFGVTYPLSRSCFTEHKHIIFMI